MDLSDIFDISRDDDGVVTSIRCNDVNQQAITIASRSSGKEEMWITAISKVLDSPSLTCIRGYSSSPKDNIKREFVLKASPADVVKVLEQGGFEKPEIVNQELGTVGDAFEGSMKNVFT